MTNQTLLLVGAGIVAVYFISKNSATTTTSTTAPTATTTASPVAAAGTSTSPTSQNSLGGSIGGLYSAGSDLYGFLTGGNNNQGSTNSTSGTSPLNDPSDGSGWVDTGLDALDGV
jgi:hypothetical protein